MDNYKSTFYPCDSEEGEFIVTSERELYTEIEDSLLYLSEEDGTVVMAINIDKIIAMKLNEFMLAFFEE